MHTIDTSLYTGCIEEIHGFLSDPRRRGNILLWLRVGILFIFCVYIFLVAPGLRCCVWAFSSCDLWGLLSSCDACTSHFCGFSLLQSTDSRVSGFSEQGQCSGCGAQASHCSGLSCCRARSLRHTAFSSRGMWAQ